MAENKRARAGLGRFNQGNVPTDNVYGNSSSFVSGGSHIMSYSGADFEFIMYVPVETASRKAVIIDEINDEINELAAQYRTLQNGIQQQKKNQNSQVGAAKLSTIRSIRHLETSADQINRTIAKLEKAQGEARKDKRNIIPRNLDGLQTMSYQIHTDKQPVRALGHGYPKGYTQGARLVAGSMIFTVIREHPLIKIIDTVNAGRVASDSSLASLGGLYDVGQSSSSYDMYPTSATADQLPPMHVNIVGVNESGNGVVVTLFGVQFINDGMVMSIQNMLTESNLSFVAQDIDIMRTTDTRGILRIPAMSRAVTASDFLSSPVAAARRARRGLPF